MKYDLKELRCAGEKACEMACENRKSLGSSAVNWADFHCTTAERIEDDDGFVYYSIGVEEASPDATG